MLRLTLACSLLVCVIGLGAAAASSIDKQAIRDTFRAHADELRACYEAALALDPTLEGKLVVELHIEGASGAVSHVEIRPDGLQDEGMRACVTTHIQRWRFPFDEPDLGTLEIVYPLKFSPGDDDSR